MLVGILWIGTRDELDKDLEVGNERRRQGGKKQSLVCIIGSGHKRQSHIFAFEFWFQQCAWLVDTRRPRCKWYSRRFSHEPASNTVWVADIETLSHCALTVAKMKFLWLMPPAVLLLHLDESGCDRWAWKQAGQVVLRLVYNHQRTHHIQPTWALGRIKSTDARMSERHWIPMRQIKKHGAPWVRKLLAFESFALQLVRTPTRRL